MKNKVSVRIHGASVHVERFLDRIRVEHGYTLVSRDSIEKEAVFDEDDLGQMEVLDLVVSFAVGVSANLATGKINALANRFRRSGDKIEIEFESEESTNGEGDSQVESTKESP